MPQGDRTGPNGMGPQTGRRAGLCTGNKTAGYMNSKPGFGTGRREFTARTGGRRGFRNQYYATGIPGWMRYSDEQQYSGSGPAPEDLQNFLKDQAEYLTKELEDINSRLSELESDK